MSVVLAILIAWLAPTMLAHGEEYELRVLIYNIHHGEGTDQKLDLDRIARVIRGAEADVVLLQEVDRNLARTERLDFPRILGESLGMEVIFEANLSWDGGDYGNATLTKLPVVSYENVALPNPAGEEPRGALRVTVSAGAQEIDVWNTHFGLKAGERASQAAALADQLRARPSILGGDLNEIVSTTPLQPLLRKLRSTADPGKPQGTVPAIRPLRRIDHIFVSEEFTVVSDQVVMTPETVIASDHLPCLAVLRLSSKEAQPAPAAPAK